MKDKKKMLIIIISILLVILGGILIIIYNINKSNKIKNENMDIINDSYSNLSENVNSYNEIRKEYLELSSNFFYETFMSDKDKYVDILNRYNEVIKDIDSNIEKINDRCNIVYSDKFINKICNNYQELYEKLINLYVMDINNYNKKIEGYNDYKNENLDKFEMIHDKYIDYNNDKIYEGVDNNEED